MQNHGAMNQIEPGHFICIHCTREVYLLPEYKVVDKGEPDALHTGSTYGLEIRSSIEQIPEDLEVYEDYLNKLDF